MEDEAEVELLEQHLLKTRQISQRMTSILSKFDTRLIKLEKSVQPIHETTQVLTRRTKNIDSTLRSIDKLASQLEGLAMEEQLILRGPRPEDLRVYTDTIEKLNANIMFQSSERSAKDTARLVEVGAQKLTQLYTKLVAEASSGSPPLKISSPTSTFPQTNRHSVQTAAPFEPNTIVALTPLVASLRKLPLPATHPSHPAAASIYSTLKDAQRGYADMRGNWARKCLENGGRRVVERLEARGGSVDDPRSGAEDFATWVKEVIGVADSEYGYLVSLAPVPAQAGLPPTFTVLLTPVLSCFTSTLNALTALIKKDLPRFTFLALWTYTLLQDLTQDWDEQITQKASDGGAELKEGLATLRGICLRSFPEIFLDVQTAAVGTGGEVGTSVAAITHKIVKYLSQLPDVLPAVTASLQALGDGNWKMGAGVGKAGRAAITTDEGQLLENFIFDIVSTTIATLTALSKTHKRQALASIFLLNNVAHLRLNLLGGGNIEELLSKPTRDALNSGFRSSKADYFSTNYTPLIACLNDDPKDTQRSDFGFGGGAKTALKEKWIRFWDSLDELLERHRFAKVMADDDEGRVLLADEAIRLTIPSLERFSTKNRDKDFAKNPAKYIKMTPDEVEIQLREMYR